MIFSARQKRLVELLQGSSRCEADSPLPARFALAASGDIIKRRRSFLIFPKQGNRHIIDIRAGGTGDDQSVDLLQRMIGIVLL